MGLFRMSQYSISTDFCENSLPDDDVGTRVVLDSISSQGLINRHNGEQYSTVVDRKPSKLTDKILQLIRKNLKYIRKFERTYPTGILRDRLLGKFPV